MSDNITPETRELILQYFNAFSNLYAIISMKRAFRIIKQQNPDIELTDETFIAFFLDYIDSEEYENQHYMIVFDEEMYDLEPEDNDPMKMFLIAEYLYSIDNVSYYELKEQQEGRKYYVPEKEELLKYADDFYDEKNAAVVAMLKFLQEDLKISETDALEVVADGIGGLSICLPEEDDGGDMLYALSRVYKVKNLEKTKYADKFEKLFEEIRKYARRHAYCGYSARELGIPIK